MNTLSDIKTFLDSYLHINDYNDFFYNGLQVEGAKDVKKIAFAVDAGMETFKKAKEQHANMVIVHHGHFSKANPSIVGWKKERIKFLLDNDISLYVAHIPLDAHPEIGNNIELLRLLNAEPIEEFCSSGGKNISWIGKTKAPVALAELENILKTNLDSKLTILPFGPEKIQRIAVCTGGPGYGTINNANVDLYVSGDAIEIYQTAQDMNLNVIFAGHYATETLGIKALQKKVQEKLNIDTVFVDTPTGL